MWVPVNTAQTPGWSGIEPFRYTHVDYGGFAGGAFASGPLSADTTTTYLMPETVWVPVDDSQ
jgi:hypothetical protein